MHIYTNINDINKNNRYYNQHGTYEKVPLPGRPSESPPVLQKLPPPPPRNQYQNNTLDDYPQIRTKPLNSHVYVDDQ